MTDNIPSEDELDGEYLGAFYGLSIIVGVVALLTGVALVAIIAIVLFGMGVRNEWKSNNLDFSSKENDKV